MIGLAALALASAAPDYRERLPEDEVIYFVLPERFENGDPSNDRGGLTGDRLKTGFDPTSKGFYHGGDLKGLTKRLDYIQGLGATAIWLGRCFRLDAGSDAVLRARRAVGSRPQGHHRVRTPVIDASCRHDRDLRVSPLTSSRPTA